MFLRVTLFVVPAILAVVLAAVAYGNPRPHRPRADGQGLGLPEPYIPIAGHYQHCAPREALSGRASAGETDAPSLELRVFDFTTGEYAGIESLMRADLYQGQPCWQDGQSEWGLLDLPVDYRACHRFRDGQPA